MKKWYNYFVYVSLVFLLIALIRGNYIAVPQIFNLYYLGLSIVFVCLGFLLDAYSWQRTLIYSDFRGVTFGAAIESMGLSIFGKYIPGKIWVVVGRSAYIAKKYAYSEQTTAVASFNGQFITAWAGLLVGIIGLGFIQANPYVLAVSLLLWLFLSVLIFSKFFHRLFTRIFVKLFKKEFLLPQIAFRNVVMIIPWFVATWLVWGFGFYFLGCSLSSGSVHPLTGLAFPLASTLGLIAFIPGGLGIREGLLVSLLISTGFKYNDAITVSVASRLWYLIGEIFIFVAAFIVNQTTLNNSLKFR